MFKEFRDDAGAADADANVTLLTPVRQDNYMAHATAGLLECWHMISREELRVNGRIVFFIILDKIMIRPIALSSIFLSDFDMFFDGRVLCCPRQFSKNHSFNVALIIFE